MQNKSIETPLEAWLTFLSEDAPERIIALITKYPEFKAMYETLYQMCQNTERVMEMFFSEELRQLDRNTVKYMIEEQQREIDQQKEELKRKDEQISQQTQQLDQQTQQIAILQKKLEQLSKQKE